MRVRLDLAAVAAVLLLAGCNTGHVVSTQAGMFSLPQDRASVKAADDFYESRVAAGYHYHVTGHVSNISVTNVNGHAHVISSAQPGDFITVTLQRLPHDVFELNGKTQTSSARSPLFVNQPGCQSDCGPDGNQTSPPQSSPTDPPNYGPCSAAGGATWMDNSSDVGGCLGRGGVRVLPCGTWSWSSPGRGRFTTKDGLFSGDGFRWVSVSPDGSTCNLGD